jgi:outer membrane receptor protein involved in Fe transport
MRGASSGQIARDQPGVKEQVGAYLDDAPVSLSLFTPDLDLFDVSRVEVLRGPQGTLFGAGLIRESWEVAVFLNNVTDEVALLGLDRERGTRARSAT